MKYFYNKLTGEFAGTKQPLGDNFKFTEQEPPAETGSGSAVFSGEAWQIVEPAPEQVQVPEFIEPMQAKLQLIKMGKYEQVLAMLETDLAMQVKWSDAKTFRRDNELINMLGAELGLTQEAIDEMFIEASKING